MKYALVALLLMGGSAMAQSPERYVAIEANSASDLTTKLNHLGSMGYKVIYMTTNRIKVAPRQGSAGARIEEGQGVPIDQGHYEEQWSAILEQR